MDTLSLLLDKDISPKVNEVLSTLGTIQQTAEEVNAAVQTFSALPFIDIGGLTQVTQQFVDLMNDVKDGVKQIDQLVDELKQGISQEVIGPIQERAALDGNRTHQSPG